MDAALGAEKLVNLKTGTCEMGTWTGCQDWTDGWDDEVLHFQKVMASNSRYDLPLSLHCKALVIPIPVRHGNFSPEFTLVVQVSVRHCKSMMLLRRNPVKLLCLPCVYLASYPGLLTPVFVTCSTNVGEVLVKLHGHVHWRTWTLGECVEEWHIHRETASKWVHYQFSTQLHPTFL